ncbi:MAG TPA: hypothetical protein VH518_19505 [Tepidisphaeraceae bacterium]|jgi:hypothetical protein
MPDPIPRRDDVLLRWSNNLSEKISAAPADYGLTPQQASEYAALDHAYAAAYGVANAPATRTAGAISAKNDARRAVVARARQLARIIRALPGVTDVQRIDLILPPRRQRGVRSGPPKSAPGLHALSTMGRTVKVRLSDVDAPASRAIPRGVKAAIIMACVGEQPVGNPSSWPVRVMTSRTTAMIRFPASLPPGSRVWLTAQWSNCSRGRSIRSGHGPRCQPIQTWIAPANTAPAVSQPIKLAA